MTKKFISLLISVIMVVGLIPVMSVSAESTVVTHFTEDFETWAEGLEFTGMNKASIYINSAGNWSNKSTLANKRFVTGSMIEKIKIEKVIGYDGEYTNALKYMPKSDASWTSSNIPGGARLQFQPEVALPQSDATLVYEVKVYIPEDEHDIQKFNFGPIVKYDYQLRDGGKATQLTDSEYCTDFRIGWNKLTAVMVPYTRNAIIYLNDECVGYKRYDHDGKINDQYPNGLAINTYKVTDWKDKYIYLDDWNIYSNPNATTASSVYSDASNVSVKANPTVDFSQMLLDTEIESVKTISKANVLMTNSDGADVDLTSVTIGSDKKSIVIVPVEPLAKGMKYNVKVTGLKDMYDQTIADAEFSFTTMEESKISCTQPTFKKENLFVYGNQGTSITSLENGYIRTDLTVSNSDTAEKEVFIIALLKEAGDIKGFQFDEVTVPASGSADFNCSFQIDDAVNQTIEIFVWDSFPGKTPLASKWTFTSSGCTETLIEEQ